ncbi:hypothetical protein NP233_g10998 [Leucocoprinus birnbaumii]|uniref:Uncharacterized protein n=1 Tax=Leucocoprinus birnbaumii TaxID=56174 RepID=A0AAD5VJQ0_9AGAR|nr:hypothetical protein NP233_g10998 [Leucocoprinus birnbaumii]
MLEEAIMYLLITTSMSYLNLFRSGSISTAKFDAVRVGVDIAVDDAGNVKPGGISVFSDKDKSWEGQCAWVLECFMPQCVGASLEVRHASRESDDIVLGDGALVGRDGTSNSNLKEKYSLQVGGGGVEIEEEYIISIGLQAKDPKKYECNHGLPAGTDHPRKGPQYVFIALASVVREEVYIAEFDDDFKYISTSAKAIADHSLDYRDLAWCDPTLAPDCRWRKERALTARAAAGYLEKRQELLRSETRDKDDVIFIENDNAILAVAFGPHLKDNPFKPEWLVY